MIFDDLCFWQAGEYQFFGSYHVALLHLFVLLPTAADGSVLFGSKWFGQFLVCELSCGFDASHSTSTCDDGPECTVDCLERVVPPAFFLWSFCCVTIAVWKRKDSRVKFWTAHEWDHWSYSSVS